MNAGYDSDVIARDCDRYRLDPEHLANPDTWGCVMAARSGWCAVEHRIALGGAHRARDDDGAPRDVLCGLTTPPW